ncbi:hypothetical protein A3Q37_05153 [Streptomyces sp. PTY087I2]|nr:hypothetical protein A3Q37_05153 [Streptomyces sp. PTY087I2]
MGYAEKRSGYWRGRYKIEDGKYGTVADSMGTVVKFATKREAKQAADAEEVTVRRGQWRDPGLGQETFGEYASRWYAAQDLAASTMQNYKRHIEEHLLPDFEDKALASILRTDVELWEKKERAAYAASSVKTWRATLHLIFEDAIDEGLITSNPAARRRGRGKRAGRSRDRGPEKVVTDALGILLTAERAALLSGRDDEFVATVLKGYTGKRWGEIVGLETEFVRPGAFRVEWQLYELDTGELVRCPPKDDSYRDIDSTDWLSALVFNHIARTKPTPCPCHGRTYVFRGQGKARTGATRARSSSTSPAVPKSPQARSRTSSTTPTAYARTPAYASNSPSQSSGSYAAEPRQSTRPTGAETVLPRGCSLRRPPAGIRRRHRRRPARYRSSASRGPASRPEAEALLLGPTPAGSRSPRVLHPTGSGTPTAR